MIKKIAIISLTGIGNNVLFVPTIKLLRRNFPVARITMIVVLRPVRDLFENCPYIDEVISLCDRKYNNFIGNLNVVVKALSLRKENYDLSLTVFPSNRKEYNLLSFLLGACTRLTHAYSDGFYRNLSFLQNKRVTVSESLHDVDQNLNLVRALGINITDKDKDISLWAKENDRKFAYKFLDDYGMVNYKPIIGFHITSYLDMMYKRWAADKFVCLANELIKKYNAKIILFGSKDDEKELERISQGINGNYIVATGNTISQTAEIVRYGRLFVSNDSGLMHLATAVNVQTIGIFGPTNYVRTSPYSKKNRVVRKEMSCSPCHLYPFVSEKLSSKCKTIDCLVEIEVEDVLNQIEELVQDPGNGLSMTAGTA